MKKAEINWALVSIVLVVVAAFILFGFFLRINTIFKGMRVDSQCMLNVIASERAKLVGSEQIPTLCRPKLVVYSLSKLSGKNETEKVALNLIDELEKCWAKFGSGKFNIFSEWTLNREWCATCAVIFYSDNKEIDSITYADLYSVANKYKKMNVLLDDFNYYFDEYIAGCLLAKRTINISFPVYILFVKKNMNKLASGILGPVTSIPKWIYRYTIGELREWWNQRGCSRQYDSSLSFNFLVNNNSQWINSAGEFIKTCQIPSTLWYDYVNNPSDNKLDDVLSIIKKVPDNPDMCKEIKSIFLNIADKNYGEFYFNSLYYYTNYNDLRNLGSQLSNLNTHLGKIDKFYFESNPTLKRLKNLCEYINKTFEGIYDKVNINCDDITSNKTAINENNWNTIFQKCINNREKNCYYVVLRSFTSINNDFSFSIFNTEFLVKLSILQAYEENNINCAQECEEHINKYYNFFYKNNYVSGVFVSSNLSEITGLCDLFVVP
ncbi:MAG: hypothetical protein QXS41_03890 [Candidatus Woesearchaeota archaeon]